MRARRLSLVFPLLSAAAVAQSADVWYPTKPGAKWIYAHETRDENGHGRDHPEVHRWTTEETITGSWTVPEGMLVERQVRIVEGAPGLGYRVPPEQADLIRENCLYRNVDWDRPSRQLTLDYRKWLTAGEYSPELCFPLSIHKVWGAPNWGGTRPASEAKDWQVVDVSGPLPLFHLKSISSYLGSGMTGEIWFQKGVGIVRDEYIHHGTLGEQRMRLVSFQAAP